MRQGINFIPEFATYPLGTAEVSVIIFSKEHYVSAFEGQFHLAKLDGDVWRWAATGTMLSYATDFTINVPKGYGHRYIVRAAPFEDSVIPPGKYRIMTGMGAWAEFIIKCE